jgi:hypothetical protein
MAIGAELWLRVFIATVFHCLILPCEGGQPGMSLSYLFIFRRGVYGTFAMAYPEM